MLASVSFHLVDMTQWRKWAAAPGLAILAASAVLLSAYAGAAGSSVTPTPVNRASADRASDSIPSMPDRGEWGYHGGSTPIGRSPVQPIAFPHPTHVGKLKMNCLYCHYSAFKAMDPGLPAVGTCMGCHLLVGPNRPDSTHPGQFRKSVGIQKLWEYNSKRQAIPWVRIHKVPDYVQFPHMRHVNAGVTCQTCHGPIQSMPQVYQYSSLNMGWCINCHLGNVRPEWKARFDCSNCHY